MRRMYSNSRYPGSPRSTPLCGTPSMNSSHASVLSMSGSSSADPSRTSRWTATRALPDRARRGARRRPEPSVTFHVTPGPGYSNGAKARAPPGVLHGRAAPGNPVDDDGREQYQRGPHQLGCGGQAEQLEAVVDDPDDQA